MAIRKYYSHDYRDFFITLFLSIPLLLRLLDIEQGQRIIFKVAAIIFQEMHMDIVKWLLTIQLCYLNVQIGG